MAHRVSIFCNIFVFLSFSFFFSFFFLPSSSSSFFSFFFFILPPTLTLLVHPILGRTLPRLTSSLSLSPLKPTKKKKLAHYFSSVTSTPTCLPWLPPKKILVLSRIDRYPFPSLSLPTSLHSFFFLYLPIQNQHLHHFIRQPHPVDPPPHFNIHQVGNPRSLDIVCLSLILNIEELACSMCRPTKYRFRSPLSLSLFSLSPPSLSFFRSLSLSPQSNPVPCPIQSGPNQKTNVHFITFFCAL